MLIKDEVMSAVNSLIYYAKEIKELTNAQYKEDLKNTEETGFDNDAATKRFNLMSAINEHAEACSTRATAIKDCIELAEQLDKDLKSKEESVDNKQQQEPEDLPF